MAIISEKKRLRAWFYAQKLLFKYASKKTTGKAKITTDCGTVKKQSASHSTSSYKKHTKFILLSIEIGKLTGMHAR